MKTAFFRVLAISGLLSCSALASAIELAPQEQMRNPAHTIGPMALNTSTETTATTNAGEQLQHDNMDHQALMNHQATSMVGTPREGGQSAFAAIQEIVNILLADPDTDWAHVDIEALRLHLIDMDNVTLRANVTGIESANGVRYTATSSDPEVSASIQNMVLAHAATMDGVDGWHFTALKTDSGAELTVEVSAADSAKIKALGFIGIMTAGMHHQSHHLALASGSNPHGH